MGCFAVLRSLGLLQATGLAAMTVLACGSASTPPGELVRSSQSRAMALSITTPDVTAVASDNTAFALDLHRAVTAANGTGNAFHSPWSISLALAMTYLGARGDTAKEMA